MTTHHISQPDAFAMLSAASQRVNRRMRDLAADIVGGGVSDGGGKPPPLETRSFHPFGFTCIPLVRLTLQRPVISKAEDMSDASRMPDPEDPRKPDDPTDLTTRSWSGVLKRTVQEFKQDDCTGWAAALTYYGVLAMFPALIALTSLIG